MYDSPLDTIRGLLDPAEATPVEQFVRMGISESAVRAALVQLQGEGEAVVVADVQGGSEGSEDQGKAGGARVQ